VVVQVGANDLQGFIQNDGAFTFNEMVDLYYRLGSVYAIIRAARPRAKLVVVNYYDLTDQRWLPDGLALGPGALPSGYVRKVFQSVPLLNWIINLAAGAQGAQKVQVIDIYQPFLHHGYGRYLGDSQAQNPMYFPNLNNGLQYFDVHPGTEGHKAIARLLEPVLY